MPEPRERFAALCALDDDEIDVAEAALVIAAEDSGAFSVEDERAKLDALAERARASDDDAAPTRERDSPATPHSGSPGRSKTSSPHG